MKRTQTLAAIAAAFGMLSGAHAADGNTRAPADTPQDRASDRRQSLDDHMADERRRQEQREEAQGGTAGAYEGAIGGTPRQANPRTGEFGSGGAQTGDLPASRGGADNVTGRKNPEAAQGDAAGKEKKRNVPEYP
ncbi:MAG TPA: hypothetical protein VKZ48_04125 [Burkholderiales bacterium]|nr:hypothetical protein [Burkholderiales bacterium]